MSGARSSLTISSLTISGSPGSLLMSGSHRSSLSISSSPGSESRRSGDGRRSVDLPLNGHSAVHSSEECDDPVQRLERELERTREEKETLATQYRNLLAKLTQMRTSLGNKLQQDAEELDRREQLVQQLSAEKDDLNVTIETLKAELILAHEETERASSQLDAMRNQILNESAHESLHRERELRETQLELERCRIERDEWERSALHEQTISEELRSTGDELRRELHLLATEKDKDALDLEHEREKTANLQSVLQDFQTAKNHEMREAVKDLETQLFQATQSLAEYKHRALTAELALEDSRTNTMKTQDLEKEVKEKKALNDKLRHEAVIINEHLMEALRRLRRNSSENNVDRRLVTNVILSFLQTPRGDTKRFEILALLSSILSWTDQEREKAGLQRSGNLELGHSNSSTFWSRSSSAATSPTKSDHEKTDETESFSRLWVEFLLTEAASGGAPAPPRKSVSNLPPPSPTAPNSRVLPPRRLSSLSSSGIVSPPTLLGGSRVPSPTSRKGKEKEPA